MKHNLIGKHYGILEVIDLSPREIWKSRNQYWLCQCQCGKTKHIRSSHLIRGKTISCGCLLKRKRKDHPNWKGYEDISGDFFYSIKSHAAQRNLSFDITMKDAWDVFIKQNRKCALTKLSLNFQSLGRNRDGTASLDRIDNSKGYTKDNIQWVHKDINTMKMDFTTEEFTNYCRLVVENTPRT